MALYDGAHYRVGYQGYLRILQQTGVLCPPTQITDPAVPSLTSMGAMLAQLPAWQQVENLTPVETVGSMRDVAQIPGRRECMIQTQILISDGKWFSNGDSQSYAVVRNHTTPCAANQRNGLQLVAVEVGAGKAFCVDSAYARVGVDALCNSFQLQMQEGQPVSAQVEFWPVALLNVAHGSEQDRHDYPTESPAAQPLIWQQVQWLYGSTDLKPLLDSATFAVTNNLYREGIRGLLMSGASELAISRTPYVILPGLEKLRVTFRLKDQLPSDLQTTSNWGQMKLYAEQAGTGAGRCKLDVTITHSHLNRAGMDQGQAGQPIRFSAETASYWVSITAGITS